MVGNRVLLLVSLKVNKVWSIEVDAVGSTVYLPPGTYYYKLRTSYSEQSKSNFTRASLKKKVLGENYVDLEIVAREDYEELYRMKFA